MGQTLVTLTIHGPQGAIQVEALADTGATFTKIPASMATQVGLVSAYEVSIELGDGRTVTRPLALAEVELVALSEDGETSLVGYTTLETLGFKVNTVTHRLERTTAIEY